MFDDRDGFIWFNNVLKPWRECKIHVLTHGLHYASSIFEGVRVYKGKPFKLTQHLNRLAASAKILDFELPYNLKQLEIGCLDTIKSQNIFNGYMRVNAWRGSDVIQVAAPKTIINVSIACWELPEGYYSRTDVLENGIRLVLSDWKKPSPDSAPLKSKAAGNYMIPTVAKNKALADGYDDALLLDSRGYIAEATGAHIFFTNSDNEIVTPTLGSVIDGITRKTVLSIAQKTGVKTEVRDISYDEVSTFDGAFLTGTACEILPIFSIGMCIYPSKNKLIARFIKEYSKCTG